MLFIANESDTNFDVCYVLPMSPTLIVTCAMYCQ